MQEELTALQQFINVVIEFCVNYSFQVLGAFVVLFLGWLAAGWVAGLLLKVFEKKNLDITLSRFIASCIKILVLAFAFIIALGKFGITIAPFIAALSAIAFGASLAIQGPLSNYGAGIAIILGRPFVVGDTITVIEQTGVVQEVKLACTILQDEDGVKITIPNKKIVGEIVHNSKANKIVEAVIGIGYDSDAEKAVNIIRDTLVKAENVIHEPVPQVGVQDFGDSSVNIGFRYWVPTDKYFRTAYKVNMQVYQAIKNGGINIPFPQRDVRIVSQPAAAGHQA